jgi:NAD(P) transhydrogenase subunit alpha
VIAAVTAAGLGSTAVVEVLGFLAVATATVNVVGGFLVTDRMLQMFRRPGARDPGKETSPK